MFILIEEDDFGYCCLFDAWNCHASRRSSTLINGYRFVFVNFLKVAVSPICDVALNGKKVIFIDRIRRQNNGSVLLKITVLLHTVLQRGRPRLKWD